MGGEFEGKVGDEREMGDWDGSILRRGKEYGD